jgi:hypothetical protein
MMKQRFSQTCVDGLKYFGNKESDEGLIIYNSSSQVDGRPYTVQP